MRKKFDTIDVLYSKSFDTPLGPMVAMASDKQLYLLEFTERRALDREIERTQRKLSCQILDGDNAVLSSIENEMNAYFSSEFEGFKTPYALIGTEFQNKIWRALTDIKYGHTIGYGALAQQLGKGQSVRALANAVGANQLAVIIPCHRVIGKNGSLNGYAGGIERKRILLNHEQSPILMCA